MGLIANWFDRAAARRGYVKADVRPPDFLVATAESSRYLMPDYSVAENQQKLYQALSWVHTAVTRIAQTAAGTRLAVFNRVGEEVEEITNHPFELLLDRPNPLQNRFLFWWATFADRSLTGNAYWWLNRPVSTEPPAEIYVLPPNRVRVIPGGQIGLIDHYEWDSGLGRKVNLPPDEVIHFKSYHPRNMFVGMSPIEAFALTAETDINAQKYNRNYFAKGNAKPPGALAFKGTVQPNLWDKMMETIKRTQGGTTREMLALQGAEDIGWVSFGLTQMEMQFLETRQFNKEEVYGIYAPGLAAMLDVNATEANSRSGKATFREEAIYPLHQSIALTITNRLMPLYGDGLVCQFDDVRLSDQAMELEKQKAYSQVHTIDEIRAEFYQKEPIGDERGLMLPAQIAPTTPLVVNQFGGSQSEAPPSDRLLETGGNQGDEQETAGEKAIEVLPVERKEAQPSPAQQERDELATWRRFVAKRVKAGRDDWREFETFHISPTLKAAVEGALEVVQSTEDVALVFADAMKGLAWEGYP